MVTPADSTVDYLTSGGAIPVLVSILVCIALVGLGVRWARWAGRSV